MTTITLEEYLNANPRYFWRFFPPVDEKYFRFQESQRNNGCKYKYPPARLSFRQLMKEKCWTFTELSERLDGYEYVEHDYSLPPPLIGETLVLNIKNLFTLRQ